ncbi:hypothetical protein H4R35_003524 [Dimargaris xerosporica]|nr:hypothetical protein H4R35_003524 [Dimargaris xerosporica]
MKKYKQRAAPTLPIQARATPATTLASTASRSEQTATTLQTPAVTFTFKSATKNLSKPSARRSLRGFDGSTTEDTAEQVEYLTGVDERGKLTLKDPKPAKQPLVIPLPQVDDWRQKRRKALADARSEPNMTATLTNGNVTSTTADNALHKGTANQAYGLIVPSKSTHTTTSRDQPVSAPIDPQRRDAADHPDDATLEDYEEVPSEDFASALLRGMSWKDGEGIGRARKAQGPLQPIELRPSLLGLGARPPPPKEPNSARPSGGHKHGPLPR